MTRRQTGTVLVVVPWWQLLLADVLLVVVSLAIGATWSSRDRG